jgi:hypothetical protein
VVVERQTRPFKGFAGVITREIYVKVTGMPRRIQAFKKNIFRA